MTKLPPPGSWLVKSTGGGKNWAHTVCWAGDFDSVEPTLIYASLKAAAPDLYVALKNFVDEECHCGEEGVIKPCVQCVARKALARVDNVLSQVLTSEEKP